MFAFVVTVEAFPVTLPTIGAVTVKPVNVPTLVNDEFTTFDANVFPVTVPAGAITALVVTPVTNPFPFVVNEGIAVEEPNVPTLPLTVANVVAFPNDDTSPVKFALVVTVAAFPVTLPTIGAVTVKPVNVPTLVNDEFTTFDASVVFVNVFASAVTVIGAVPLNETPLIN